MNNGLLRPAFLGGLLIGVLSALPLISAGNCCCCLWVVSGGMLAAYLLQQDRPTAIDAGDGALVGLLAGIVGAIVSSVLSVPISLTFGPIQQRLVERLLANLPNVPPEMQNAFDSMRSDGIGAVIFRRGRPRVAPAGDASTPAV